MKKLAKDLTNGTLILIYNALYKVVVPKEDSGFNGCMLEILPAENSQGFRRFIEKRQEVEVVKEF